MNNEIPQLYEAVSVEDRNNPPPKDTNFIVLFDTGEVRRYFEDHPFALYTHWLRPLPNHVAISVERLSALEKFIRDCAVSFDCDKDAHRYGTQCRACDAEKLLKSITK